MAANTPPMVGIYEIRNLINSKRYVGSSVNIVARFKEHKKCLKENSHHSVALQNAWNKYGADSFDFKVLAIISKDCLRDTEQRLLDFVFNSDNDNYNSSRSATSPMRGRLHSDTTKLLMSKSNMGKNNPFYGKTHSKEVIDIITKAHRGKPSWSKGKTFSDEHKQKLSDAKRGKRPHNYGVTSSHCKNGHLRTVETIYKYKNKTACRICRAHATERYNLKKENDIGS